MDASALPKLKDKAYTIIRNKIISCELMPGAVVDQNALMREIGVSKTPVREAVSALEIEDALRGSHGRAVSRASVYRILDELEQMGLVQRVEIGQAMVRYERVCGHDEHHHHLVCDACGVVIPFSDPALERAITDLSKRVPLVVSEHEIVLHGSCQDCAA